MDSSGSREPKPPLPPDIEELHKAVCAQGGETYEDPATGYTVFTELFHKKRGYCCGNRCRHCPYEWQHVGDPKAVREAAAAAKEREREQRNQGNGAVAAAAASPPGAPAGVEQRAPDALSTPASPGCVTMMGGGGSGALLLGRHRVPIGPVTATAHAYGAAAPSSVWAWMGKGGARARLVAAGAAGAASLVAAVADSSSDS